MFGVMLLAATLACCAGSPVPHATLSLDSLAVASARGTARFKDRAVAVAEGYRRVGTDFPGMGEHWLQPTAFLSQRIDPTRPTLLEYASINGTPTLLGVGFVVTTHGDSVNQGIPGWPAAWHEHSGLLAEESGAGASLPRPSAAGTRVWVLHIWTVLENPAGPYAADNWALPFVRGGVTPPGRVDADAGRAMSLAVGGDAYLKAILGTAGLRTVSTAPAIDTEIAVSRERVQALTGQMRTGTLADDEVLVSLRGEWSALAVNLRRVVGAGVDAVMSPPHAHRNAPFEPSR